ncbi:MAG: protein kinase [Corynebacteriales bacterium]|nr:protein kinase [Mycobacteriales bacterium]
MGTVWRAFDQLLQREVAVKEVLIHDGLPDREREMLCERTFREARAAAQLDHSSVIRVYDVVQDSDRPWIIMEVLDSRSLAEIIADDGILPPLRVAEIGLSVLSALQAAHKLDILHRDVKPGNVLICPNGRVVLTDFGVARSPNESRLTSTGLLLGSPQYIAPERARGRPFGAPSDLFSLGATLYAALEGKPPFDRGEPIPTMTAVVCEPPDPMPNAGPLEDVILGLLEKNADERWDAERTKSAMRAVIAAERRRNSTEEAPPRRIREQTAPPSAPKIVKKLPDRPRGTTPTKHRGGRHRRSGEGDLFTALTRPIMTAAEATAAIVVSRNNSGRHASDTGLPSAAPATAPSVAKESAWANPPTWGMLIAAFTAAIGLGILLAVLAS